MKTNKKILVIGSSNTDMSVKTSVLPKPGETVIGGVFRMGQGGKGANQAVAAKKLGGDVSFVCKLGRDIFGENALAHYAEVGLDTGRVLYSDKPSGVALICIDDKAENSIVVASGANSEVTDVDIESLSGLIRESEILLLQLEIPLPAVVKAAEIARSSGVMVVLNPAPAVELPDELLKCVTLLIPNECEAASISGIEINDEDTARMSVKAIKDKGVSNVIVTMGSKGAMVYDDEMSFIPALKVNAVDTTAAGDTFCGGVCVALAEGKSLKDAVKFATAASAIAVQRHGAQDSVPTREEVDRLIETINY